ncbi:hypothetical protein AB9G99_00010 [Escherichia coli]|uniref:hypothetical protein n=1 Tax=Escherichia coli TaxID=562 RepID=UPI0011E5E7D8|nr:hypothetical protein [Escherichia coli]EFW2356200.1 hypothetical protein [Shigella sonnei]EFG2223405.1 hypothetical protein [Escherichia coli]EFK2540354.1 hypothetical protein [Escherichia coli]EFL1006586.1 hypothetical protein [Escherichia coli]EFW4145362.1 hypothetical protein [Shigella sonnei]
MGYHYRHQKIAFWCSVGLVKRIFEQNHNELADNMREDVPLAAAPATERSERVGEEAEES